MSAKRNRLRVYYEVGKNEARSTRWQIWAHGTSFYLTNSAVGGLKMSLHGFDAQRPDSGQFHVRPFDRSGLVEASDVRLKAPNEGWPCRFEGSPTDEGRLAIRIRTTNRACSLSPPRAPPFPKPSSMRAAVDLPAGGWSADLDLTFQQLPASFTPADHHSSFLDVGHAGSSMRVPLPGPSGDGDPGFILRNEAGVVLRGRTRNRRFDVMPAPTDLLGRPMGGEPSPPPRQIAFGVDKDGVLWVVEDAEYWLYVRPLGQ